MQHIVRGSRRVGQGVPKAGYSHAEQLFDCSALAPAATTELRAEAGQHLLRGLSPRDHCSGERVEDQQTQVKFIVEVEHVRNRSSQSIEGSLARGRLEFINILETPIILDKTKARSLIRYCVFDEIRFSPRRNDQEGQARAIAAPSLHGSGSGSAADTRTVDVAGSGR